MKEQIIAILINHVRELAGQSWIMGIPKNDVDVVAEEIDALFKVAEMPTEEEIERAANNIADPTQKNAFYRGEWIGFKEGARWFRNRMSKPNNCTGGEEG